MDDEERFSSYSYGEARTGNGQVVEFSYPTTSSREEIASFIKTHVRDIDLPATRQVNVGHGGYGQYSRFNIKQHKYAGGGPGESGGWGYIEVLEIQNPPNEKLGIVINERTSRDGGTFTEWDTLENALSAFEANWGGSQTKERLPKCIGFRRRVDCGLLRPWFYAIGDEQLLGDYAFPEGLQDDEVYRLGKKFVVYNYDGVPVIKTCMGTRYVTESRHSGRTGRYENVRYRIVQWDDGTMWNENNTPGAHPRHAEEGELWIAEATEQFRKFLAGRTNEFVVRFTDGNKFVGRLVQPDRPRLCAEGRYSLIVHLKDGKKKEGWVDFTPTSEYTNVVQYVTKKLAKKNEEVASVEVKKGETKKGGKKWAGVFLAPSAKSA